MSSLSNLHLWFQLQFLVCWPKSYFKNAHLFSSLSQFFFFFLTALETLIFQLRESWRFRETKLLRTVSTQWSLGAMGKYFNFLSFRWTVIRGPLNSFRRSWYNSLFSGHISNLNNISYIAFSHLSLCSLLPFSCCLVSSAE